MNTVGLSGLGQRTTDPPISWLMKMTLDRPQLVSLAAGFTDDVSLPVAEMRELAREILASHKLARKALQYGSTEGDRHLRQLTAQRLRRQDGAAAAPDQVYAPERVIITHGSQQLLYLITECLCDPGDVVLVEDPTYFVYLSILKSRGVLARGIRLADDGLDLKDLERVLEALKRSGELQRLKLLYVVSYFQNPSGITTSFAKKQAALALLRSYEKAAGHAIYLLEDAAYRDLRFAGENVPSTLAVGGSADRVLYAGTYSKPFATGLRVGFGLLPKPIFNVVARVKGNHDFGTSHFPQQVLAKALASHRYETHVAVLQRRYRTKARVMVSAICAHFPESVHWQEPRGGLYVWAKVPSPARTGPSSVVFKTAVSQDVLYVPGELCYADDARRRKPRDEMRLSFGGASEKNIREGIARLGKVLREVAG